MTLRAATYTRSSTVEQADTNHSLEAQASALEAHATAQGWDVTYRFANPGFSGTVMERPGLSALLSAVREKQLDVVLVYRLDRLLDQSQFQRQQYGPSPVTGTEFNQDARQVIFDCSLFQAGQISQFPI